MRVLPLCYCENLSAEDVLQHESSDRVWVPRHMFERWMDAEEVGSVVILSMDSQAACMWAYHTGDPDTLYVPRWMCEALNVPLDPYEDDIPVYDDSESEDNDVEGSNSLDQGIVPIRYTPAMCTSVVLQPFTGEHLNVPDETPDEALSRGFENYTCLTEGQTMSLRLTNGEIVIVTVTEAHPRPTKEGAKPKPLCIRNTEVVLDLLPPLEAVVDSVAEPLTSNNILPPEVLERLSASLAKPESLTIPHMHPQLPEAAVPPQVAPLDREARRALMAQAAVSRMAKATEVQASSA